MQQQIENKYYNGIFKLKYISNFTKSKSSRF